MSFVGVSRDDHPWSKVIQVKNDRLLALHHRYVTITITILIDVIGVMYESDTLVS